MYFECLKKIEKNYCKIRHLIIVIINNVTHEHYGAY